MTMWQRKSTKRGADDSAVQKRSAESVDALLILWKLTGNI